MHSPDGPFRLADVAAPPSPEYEAIPVPAKVDTFPVDFETALTDCPLESDIYILNESPMIPNGELKPADVAAKPSPVGEESVLPAKGYIYVPV